jgi:hypothetical protein
MAFTRHVGKHGDRKVAVVFREVPGEPHMALVVYTQLLNQNIHDPLINCIDSDIGQNSNSLSDALNRMHTRDGKILLQVLHSEGMLKKVQTEQIIMTPQPNTTIKLSDLNKMLDEMEKGEAAVKRMAELDSQRGIQDPAQVARRMREGRDAQTAPLVASSGDVLGDNTLANNLRQQAAKMSAEAKGLLAEADRMMKEAAALDPAPVAVEEPTVTTKVTKAKKTKTKVTV